MKKAVSLLAAILLIFVFGVFAIGSGESENSNQGEGTAEKTEETNSDIGDYSVEINSCRLAKDYEGKAVVIIKYLFTNNSNDTATSFITAFDDNVYQAGVGLNGAFILDDSANYSSDNQMKEIKKGASLEVEVAYQLNDTVTDVEVEVKELFSFDDKTLTKTFKIS